MDLAPDAHIYVTISDEDENQVLELVGVDDTGMYVRDNGNWMITNPDDDNPRIWDRQIIDMTPEVVEAYDELIDEEGNATVDRLEQYEVPEGATA